nr:glycosyltransferase [Mesobacillus maritimus]
MTHSTHLRPPYNVDSELRLGNRAVLNNLNKVDGLVLLTKHQKNDIRKRFGERENYFVIPHSTENELEESTVKYKRKKYTGVMMARYHEEKQIDHVITAFERVIKVFPEARMEIYGFGDEEDNLNELIRKLKLNNNVFLKGFTSSPGKVFEESTFSVLTSKYEGFGMSLVESLIHGCPLICYDMKYGPRDMIENGKNGYLVRQNDVEDLANHIIKMFSNQDKLADFSLNSRIKAKEFSNEKFIANWLKMFKEIIEKKDNFINIDNYDFYMEHSYWISSEKLDYYIEGTVNIKPEVNQNEIKKVKAKIVLRERESKETIEIQNSVQIKDGGKVKIHFSLNALIDDKDQGILKKGIWDLSLILYGNNYYQEKRIGYTKSESAIKSLKALHVNEMGLLIEPYYTNPYGNISFKIGF